MKGWRESCTAYAEISVCFKQKPCTVICKNLVAFDTTILQHWCKDFASEYACNLMTCNIYCCIVNSSLCMVCFIAIEQSVWCFRKSCKDIRSHNFT